MAKGKNRQASQPRRRRSKSSQASQGTPIHTVQATISSPNTMAIPASQIRTPVTYEISSVLFPELTADMLRYERVRLKSVKATLVNGLGHRGGVLGLFVSIYPLSKADSNSISRLQQNGGSIGPSNRAKLVSNVIRGEDHWHAATSGAVLADSTVLGYVYIVWEGASSSEKFSSFAHLSLQIHLEYTGT